MVARPGDLPPWIPAALLDRALRWPEMKRWERRELACAMRTLGLSYREIGMVVPVARSTLSGWCRDLVLTEEQRARLASQRPSAAVRREVGARRRARSLQEVQRMRAAARAEALLLARDPFWVAGVVAYWAEGDKRSNRIRFSNSDADMIRLFTTWCRRHLGATEGSFSAELHLHSGLEEGSIKAYWSKTTGIPQDAFTKTFVKPEGSGHRKNVLHRGTISIRLRRSTEAFHRLMGWIDGIRDLGCDVRLPSL